MDKVVQERFERMEAILDRALQLQNDFNPSIRSAHMEVETSQINANKTIDRLSGKLEGLTDQVNNLRILVDQLIKKDMDR